MTETERGIDAANPAPADRRRIAEAQAETCREAQYTAMRAAIAAGMSAYRVAQLTGMTQRAVHRIRDREIGAAATRE